MKIDRNTTKEIQSKLRDFLNSLEGEYGIKVSKSSATFSEATIRFRMEVAVTPDNRDDGVLTPAEGRYDMERRIDPTLPARGSVVKDAYGESYVVKEWLPKGRKYQVLMEKVSDGKRYKFAASSLKRMLVV